MHAVILHALPDSGGTCPADPGFGRWTATKDDREGLQHARKFAAKLAAMGEPDLYFEVTEGGLASSATPKHAQMAPREYTYFQGRLEP